MLTIATKVADLVEKYPARHESWLLMASPADVFRKIAYEISVDLKSEKAQDWSLEQCKAHVRSKLASEINFISRAVNIYQLSQDIDNLDPSSLKSSVEPTISNVNPGIKFSL